MRAEKTSGVGQVTLYDSARQNHASALARYREKAQLPVAPTTAYEPNPARCKPFDTTGADTIQRIECGSRMRCLDVAAIRNWPAWTCVQCGVRDERKDELPTRRFYDGDMPVHT